MFELGCHLIDSLHVAMGLLNESRPFHVQPTLKRLSRRQHASCIRLPQSTNTIRSAMMEVDGFRRRQFIVVGSEGTIILRHSRSQS